MRPSQMLRAGRRLVGLADRYEFARAFAPRTKPPPFGAEWVATFLPHYFTAAQPADFHASLFEHLRDLHTRRDTKSAVVAPREGAKSTVVTLAYVLYCAVERHEAYTAILSDSAGQAQDRLREVRAELETNPAIAEHYPDAAGIGPVWRNDRLTLRNGSVVGSYGTGQRIRGRRAQQSRPSLVVFDDVENNATITSPAKRQAAWRWATREVIPAGTNGTNFIAVGSALHRECVAVKLGQLPGWSGHTYRAVHKWPDRMDLWDQWERVATNLADDQRQDTALRFYEANQAAMDAGGRVYWPARWPLYALMKRRAEIGAAAFDTEYQGIPAVEGLTEWPADWLDDRPGKPFWFDEWPTDIVFRVLALDPSKGRADRAADYQAHALVGLTKTGDLYVETWLYHEPAVAMAARAVDLAAANRADVLTVEDNEGLGLLLPEIDRLRCARGLPLPVTGIINTVAKVTRIRWLGNYLRSGLLHFRRTPGTRLTVDQARDFPQGEHDDGIDAVEMGVRTIEERSKRRR
jgi:predicted phage terminase large subunit-like protein